jgi:hypothetical protein
MSARAAVALCVILLLPGGCATRIRNIPTHPLTKQTNGMAERDHQECLRAISGTLKGVWFPAEVEFAACMIARNYKVYVQMLDASVYVSKASLRDRRTPARIQSHLVTCERAAARNLTLAEKIARPAVMVAGVFFFPVSIASMAASAQLAVVRQQDYADCMKPLGYVVTVWEPPADEPAFKPTERTQ